MTSRITFEGKQSELHMVDVLNEVAQSSAKRLTGSSKKGDIEWHCQKFTIVVEVKKKTYNQTRPCKYLVVVSPIYAKDGSWTGKWRVMSPVQVIKNLRHTQAKELKIKRGEKKMNLETLIYEVIVLCIVSSGSTMALGYFLSK